MKNITFLTIALLMLISLPVFSQSDKIFNLKKTVSGDFEEVTNRTKEALKKQGFGIASEMDMDKKLKSKLANVQMRPYRILGVCNPAHAYQSIQQESNIGLLLPCKVLLKDLGNGKVEIVMADPVVLMETIKNKELDKIAAEVTRKLEKALKDI